MAALLLLPAAVIQAQEDGDTYILYYEDCKASSQIRISYRVRFDERMSKEAAQSALHHSSGV